VNVIADQATATVCEVKDVQTGIPFAVKIPKENCPQVGDELSILQGLSHPSIIPVNGLQTPNGVCLVMPYAFGGDLLSWIQSRPLDEDTVKGIIFNILQALVYLHGQQIWHRDIKPENLLVMDHALSPDCVVLADFGFARRFPNGFCDDEFPGSLQYAAPELIRGDSYTEKVDIWALDITMYGCLTGAHPFASDPDLQRAAILAGLPDLFEREGLDVSDECRALLDRMLTADPSQRPSAEQALEHEWFADLWECSEASDSSGFEAARWNCAN
jgi:serine/threonine protein kinase